MGRPKNWDELSEDAREAWRVKRSQQQRKYYETNREEIAEQKREYYEANREKALERHRKYQKANREKVLERKRKWQQENREELAEYHRKHYAKLRTQADADRFFQLMNAANEIKKAISEINQSYEI